MKSLKNGKSAAKPVMEGSTTISIESRIQVIGIRNGRLIIIYIINVYNYIEDIVSSHVKA